MSISCKVFNNLADNVKTEPSHKIKLVNYWFLHPVIYSIEPLARVKIKNSANKIDLTAVKLLLTPSIS